MPIESMSRFVAVSPNRKSITYKKISPLGSEEGIFLSLSDDSVLRLTFEDLLNILRALGKELNEHRWAPQVMWEEDVNDRVERIFHAVAELDAQLYRLDEAYEDCDPPVIYVERQHYGFEIFAHHPQCKKGLIGGCKPTQTKLVTSASSMD